jgi:hypothetical protein
VISFSSGSRWSWSTTQGQIKNVIWPKSGRVASQNGITPAKRKILSLLTKLLMRYLGPRTLSIPGALCAFAQARAFQDSSTISGSAVGKQAAVAFLGRASTPEWVRSLRTSTRRELVVPIYLRSVKEKCQSRIASEKGTCRKLPAFEVR